MLNSSLPRKLKLKTPNNVGNLEKIIEKIVDSLNYRIDSAQVEQADKFVILDVDEFFSRYSMSVAFKCLYRQDNKIDFRADEDKFVKLINQSLKDCPRILFTLLSIYPALKPIIFWLSITLTTDGEARRNILSYINQQAESNLAMKNEIESGASNVMQNLLDHVIDQYHLGKISRREYTNTAFFLFYATNKTTSDTLAMLINSLALHQDVQDKLRRSIEERGAESEYLTWCINETLRLFPPAPISGTRKISRDYVTREGYLIPAKTALYPSVYAIHRMPEYWGPDANEFKPERWARAKEFHPVQFLGFGVGKRDCLGKHFAMQAIRLLTSSLLKQFRLDRCLETKEVKTFESPYLIFVVFKDPVLVKISKLSEEP